MWTFDGGGESQPVSFASKNHNPICLNTVGLLIISALLLSEPTVILRPSQLFTAKCLVGDEHGVSGRVEHTSLTAQTGCSVLFDRSLVLSLHLMQTTNMIVQLD